MICEYCGAKIADGSLFCSQCGKQVGAPNENNPAEETDALNAPSAYFTPSPKMPVATAKPPQQSAYFTPNARRTTKQKKVKSPVELRPTTLPVVKESSVSHKPLVKGKFDIVDGLPIPAGTTCKVAVYADQMVVEGLGQRFTLPQRRIFNVTVVTEKQIRKQYVSSAGGAVAGGMLLGPLGAIIGGSAKQKTVRNNDRFLVFSYRDSEGDGAKYLVFSVKDSLFDKSSDFVKAFKPRSRQVQMTTEL